MDTNRVFKAPNSIYLGDPECRTYYNGLLNDTCDPVTAGQDATAIRVILYSPTLNLANSDGNAGSAALFWYWSDVEPDLGLGVAEPDVLRAFVDVLDGSGMKWTVASTLDTGKNTFGQWLPMAIDLAYRLYFYPAKSGSTSRWHYLVTGQMNCLAAMGVTVCRLAPTLHTLIRSWH